MATPSHVRRYALAAFVLLALTACSRSGGDLSEKLNASSGQVKPVVAGSVSHYAAARFAEQASFGATPALVAEIERKGFSKWIEDQFALPLSLIDAAPISNYDSQVSELGVAAYKFAHVQLYASMLAAPDQLRRRMSWSLSQFITTATNKIEPYGSLAYSNLLQRQAFSNFGELIRAVTVNPVMGRYLDNLDNRPTTAQCTWCAPNENYARELMQLFTLGVMKLNLDGTVQRDAAGRPAESYSQKDVEELARALTGWAVSGSYNRTDFHRYDGELTPDSWAPAHDRGAKSVLGRPFPANVEAAQELDAVVALLMAHQNIAPFVSLRLIQHFVTSAPTPAYVARVATVFRNNGQGVAGDMKAVLKAILLDSEARRGDQLGTDSAAFGKMREPVLWYTGVLRGLACTTPLLWDAEGWTMTSAQQMPFDPISVFSFYAPTDRAPGSNLLAPEQRLLNAEELSFRLGNFFDGVRRNGVNCDAGPFVRAFSNSPTAFVDLVSERYFRGTMPAVLRQNLLDLAPTTYGQSADEKAISLLQYALSTPYYGVIR